MKGAVTVTVFESIPLPEKCTNNLTVVDTNSKNIGRSDFGAAPVRNKRRIDDFAGPAGDDVRLGRRLEVPGVDFIKPFRPKFTGKT
jgi:hypothetical protein